MIQENCPEIDKVEVLGNYSPSGHEASRIVSSSSYPTFKENHGTIPAIIQNLRIRKLTPKECFRLMGLKDEDIEKIMEHQTAASGYHLAGDSIVTTCLMAIFGQLLDIDWKDKFKPELWWKNE